MPPHRGESSFKRQGDIEYPSEINKVLNAIPGYGGEHRIIVSRQGAMDELLVRVEADATHGESSRLAAFGRHCAADLQKLLEVRVKVKPVVAGTFPRTDFKARRLIDDRNPYLELDTKLKGWVHPASRRVSPQPLSVALELLYVVVGK